MSQSIETLLRLMAHLRDPALGCPWDRAQTLRSLTRYTVEEVFEVVDCIERDALAELPDELGDLLFQIVFYARVAEEDGRFDFGEVVARIVDKLTRRHPHVFGHAPAVDIKTQTARWETLKAEERARASDRTSALDDVPLALPALMRAAKLQGRAGRVGFDWPAPAPVFEKLQEEMAELAQAMAGTDPARVEDEMGDVLFTCVNLARHLGIEPETALRRANAKFEQRFRLMEAMAAEQGSGLESLSPTAQDQFWRAAKQRLARR